MPNNMTPPPAPGSQSVNDLNNLRGLAKKVYGAVPKDAEKRKKRKFSYLEKLKEKYNSY